MSLSSHELAKLLLAKEDKPLLVSVDPIECLCGEVRVFGSCSEVIECRNDVTLLCEGHFNKTDREVMMSLGLYKEQGG